MTITQAIFINLDNKDVCKKKFLNIHELSKLHNRYMVYMLGLHFIIPQNYKEIKAPEVKPEGFIETTGVSQTIMMYKNLNRIMDEEIERRR